LKDETTDDITQKLPLTVLAIRAISHRGQ